MISVTRAAVLTGKEVLNGYVQLTSNFTSSTTGDVDITDLTLTFTPLQAAVDLSLGGLDVSQSATATTPQVYITDSSGVHLAGADETALTGALKFSLGMVKARLTLTAGTSYTFKGMANRGGGSGTLTISAASTAPLWMQAIYR